MKVTFVALGCEQLPVSLLAAIARREGHEVSLAFSASLFNDRYQFNVPFLARHLDDRAAMMESIRAQRPDVLACSVLTTVYPWMLEVAREAKQLFPALKVVFGGVHASAVPDVVMAEDVVDFVCVGEGDVAFPALLASLEQGGPHTPIPNIRHRLGDGTVVRGPQAGFVQDLDSLPFFDKQLWEDHVRVGDFYMTMASRGCPYRCTFCFNNFFARLPDGKRGKYVRQRSVDHMMGELVAAKRRYRIRFVDFEDDIFTVDKKWLRAFLDRYKREIRLPFQCLTHARYMDAEIAAWLRDAGCRVAQMGVQSVDEEFKTVTLKRYEDNDSVLGAIDVLNAAGIKLKGDHIFGLPGEPAGAQEAARRAYALHTPARIDTFWATYFPGTEMLADARRLGLVTDDDIAQINRGLFRTYHDGGHVPEAQLRSYHAHELLFRAMPLLPRSLRGRIDPRWLEFLPNRASKMAEIGVDMVNALKNVSAEHIAYGLHYALHLGRFGKRKLGVGVGPATTPRGADRLRK